jgi:hypothetical protein
VVRRYRWRVWHVGFALCCQSVASTAHAQQSPTVIAISGELTATRLSRSVAQRVGTLLRKEHPEYVVVSADSIAWLLDRTAYSGPQSPIMPEDLRFVCREFRATAIVDIIMFEHRGMYRGVAFRPVLLRRPSKPALPQTSLLMIGQAVSSTTDSVAAELMPMIIDGLRSGLAVSPAERRTVRCLEFTDAADTVPLAPRQPSNPRCC